MIDGVYDRRRECDGRLPPPAPHENCRRPRRRPAVDAPTPLEFIVGAASRLIGGFSDRAALAFAAQFFHTGTDRCEIVGSTGTAHRTS
jgi:hypothetical protein